MAKLNNNVTILTLMTLTVFFLFACAGTTPGVQPIPKSANPTDVVNEFDVEIATARKNQLNVLSPDWFSKAETSLARAKKALSRGEEISEIMENVAKGRGQLKTAEEMAQVARTTLPELIKSREMARAAGATKIKAYAAVEDDFLMLTKAIEQNNLRLAQRDRGNVSKAFRALELQAIKDQTIGEFRKLLAQAENDGARKYAPHSLSMAQQKLKNTDAFITQNPYEKAKMQEMANDALFYAQRLVQMNKQIQNYFDSDEAEVYKQGGQLVIRLRAIKFPVGKDIIMPKNYELLSIVQKSIRTFGEPDVVIEGHTDSTGSDEVNEHLSQQRAEAVRQYLVANQTLPYDRIMAVGYGSMRPLASNETADGRAINRRIDVILKP